ncbi:MAG: EAL domain-containing protein [Candidatus Heteroscillospira sp.]|jgi:diguanylate cyclase (GGDEF)-like protein
MVIVRKKLSGALLRFFCLCVALTFLPLPQHAEATQKVRVGFYSKDGYHTVDNAGVHSGYDYEYLMKLASYTGWEYEFVEGSWAQCKEWLENGEIDLLTGVEKDSERQDTMLFSDAPTMYVCATLILSPTVDCDYEDFEAFNGMHIGTVTGSNMSRSLASYSNKNGFEYSPVYFSSSAEIFKALDVGEIDAACLASNQNLNRYSAVAYFGYTQFHYAVSTARPELLVQLNEAIGRLNSEDRDFARSLQDKYFAEPSTIAFTREEREFIANSGPVTVGVYPAMGRLYCQYDSSSGECSGIIIEALELLGRRTGLSFRYEDATGTLPWEYLQEHPNALAAPLLLNELLDYTPDHGVIFLNPLATSHMNIITRPGESVALTDSFRLALLVGDYAYQPVLRSYFPQAEIVSCSSYRECLEFTASGKADAALVSDIISVYDMQSPYLSELQVSRITGVSEYLTAALSKESSPLLLSILKKGVASMSESDVRQIIVDNTVAFPYKPSADEWMYQNRLPLILASIAGIFVLTSAVLVVKSRKRRIALRLADELHRSDMEHQALMFRQANFDALTGLYNQNYFCAKANELLREHPDTVYTFLRINIKKFKMINDLYSQKAGDAVLCAIAGSLRDTIGDRGIYGRLYSDHFAVCLQAEHEELEAIMDKCIQYLEHDGQRICIQIAVGVYVNSTHCVNSVQALDYAQIALNSKADKPGTLFFYRDSDLENLRFIQWITNEMEQALREEQFQPYLQPQFDLASGKLVGAEALTRWFSPTRGNIPPNHFIPVFEENGFIYKLDSYMCRKICELLRDWHRAGKIVPISVNLSKSELENPELPSMLMENLERCGVPPRYLHLEITESMFSENLEKFSQLVAALQQHGFTIEMDDFGSGYSTLNMLKDVPVDILKLDMRFFAGERNMGRGGTIIESVIQMAHALGMPVVAEGVETQREADFLKSVNCDIVQGYLYGRPMPTAEFESFLSSSEVSEKSLPAVSDMDMDIYWRANKYDFLIQNVDVLLFDYDPESGCAVLTSSRSKSWGENRMVADILNHLDKSGWTTPDSAAVLTAALKREAPEQETFTLQLSPLKNGHYESFEVCMRRYINDGQLRRIIAVIQPEIK